MCTLLAPQPHASSYLPFWCILYLYLAASHSAWQPARSFPVFLPFSSPTRPFRPQLKSTSVENSLLSHTIVLRLPARLQ
ncbi:hypothetical protein JB92DRAFT_1622320 [Gautieria morchelliformis]|nr:hypothetical protein JB92DRAFT_1622320 [Gautieria morchelliformis]